MRVRSVSEKKLLLIDAGNTCLKWLYLDSSSESIDPGCVPSVLSWDELSTAFSGPDFNEFNAGCLNVVVSCVAADDRRKALDCVIKQKFGEVFPLYIEAAQGLGGLTYVYSDISRLGIDRILAMVAARQRLAGAFMVIDCGSAITADLVDARSNHLGGYIFPGLRLLKESLRLGTGNVAVSESEFGDVSPGVDTEMCVEHAINFMLQATAKELVSLSEQYEVGAVYITGGDAERFVGVGDLSFKKVDLLVFEGMLALYRRRDLYLCV